MFLPLVARVPSVPMSDGLPGEWRTEVELVRFLEVVLRTRYPDAIIERESLLDDRLRPDLIMHLGDDVYIIEVKRVTPLTEIRLEDTREQLIRYRAAALHKYRGRTVRSVLVVPGVFSTEKIESLTAVGVEVWDKAWLGAAIQGEPLWHYKGQAPPHSPSSSQSQIEHCKKLRSELSAIKPGLRAWSKYQKICMEIWEVLFYPELSRPINESTNETGVNRRDFVVPNYAADGFWAFMRNHYRADYVVVDAKNLSGHVSKSHVLQIANYMTRSGTGLFGVIMTRRGTDRSAQYTRREQWVLYNKMLLILDDDDVIQMLDNVIGGDDPSLVIRQKVEDFRLSL
jgi:hypothetical protein